MQMMEDESEHLSLTDFPCEIIEQILRCEELGFVDICRVSQVCRKLYDIIDTKSLWRFKFGQQYPSLSDISVRWQPDVDWRSECKWRCLYGKQMRKWAMSVHRQGNYSILMHDGLTAFEAAPSVNKFATDYMLDELELILHEGSRYKNLTVKYFSAKLMIFGRQRCFRKYLKEFLKTEPENYKKMETGTFLLSHYMHPNKRVRPEDITEKLDAMALKVKEVVKQQCQHHPVLTVDLISPSTILDSSMWLPSDCKIILACLNTALYQDLSFEVFHSEDYCGEHGHLINKVLKLRNGRSITMCVIYAGIAHRLGVHCEVIELVGYYTLKFLENPELEERERYTYIDATEHGKCLNKYELYTMVGLEEGVADISSPMSPSVVMREMIKCLNIMDINHSNTVRDRLAYHISAVELYLLVFPHDIGKLTRLAQLYFQTDDRILEVQKLMEHLPDLESGEFHSLHAVISNLSDNLGSKPGMNPNRHTNAKRRWENPTVKFAVGMLMRHKRYNYTCIIYGWDPTCRASEDWVIQMRVHELEYAKNQPFYNVLADDGTERYAAQENLAVVHGPLFIDHPEIGKHFDEFQVAFYIPNVITTETYPDDQAFCAKFYEPLLFAIADLAKN